MRKANLRQRWTHLVALGIVATGIGWSQVAPMVLYELGRSAGFRLQEGAGAAVVEPVELPGAPVTAGLRLSITEPLNPGETVRASAPIAERVDANDVLLVEFWGRAVEAEQLPAKVEVRFEPGLTRYSSPLRMVARLDRQWRKVQYPFTVSRNYGPGEARLELVARRQRATVELVGLRLLNYRNTVRKEDLPCTRLDYPGSELQASWRTAADQRIEKLRKAELVVRVVDRKGRVLPGASVRVRMQRHAFGFGTAVSAPLLLGQARNASPEDVERYRRELLRLFNKAVVENHLKWPLWIDPQQRELAIRSVEWLRAHGLKVRGHVLVWPSWRWMPPQAVALKDRPHELRWFILEHIRDEVGALRGKIAEWDVLNEPYSNHDVMDLLGRDVMAEWFVQARQVDPEAKLYINDYDILTTYDPPHRDHYEATIRFLLERGAPLDGIGMQGHFKSEVTGPEELLAILDRFARFGKALQITEFDVDTVDERLQADFTRDLMTVAFSHPAVEGFLMWGFWEGQHWIPNGAMFRRDWTPKPNARVYEELVFRRWWTDVNGRTGNDGVYRTRGFLGEYLVEAELGDRRVERRLELRKPGVTVELVL